MNHPDAAFWDCNTGNDCGHCDACYYREQEERKIEAADEDNLRRFLLHTVSIAHAEAEGTLAARFTRID